MLWSVLYSTMSAFRTRSVEPRRELSGPKLCETCRPTLQWWRLQTAKQCVFDASSPLSGRDNSFFPIRVEPHLQDSSASIHTRLIDKSFTLIKTLLSRKGPCFLAGL